MKREVPTVGLVQINNSFSGQDYFPLSAGMLQAYAQKILGDSVNFLPIVFFRSPIDDIVKRFLTADVVGFSTYVWNSKISLAISERLKILKPEIITVFGGHHIPCRMTEEFLRIHRCIDIACHGDGEKIFTSILKNLDSDWQGISSISYLDEDDNYIETAKVLRAKNLDDLPSPYLNGVFNRLIIENPKCRWVGIWETNRGCPFLCSWCDWQGSKLGKWNLERIYQEIEWFARNKVEYIFCADANFGILPRDVEIAQKLVEAKLRFGYPQAFSIQSTKNVQERSFQVQKILADADMNKAVIMALQSLHSPTLKAVKRDNISLKVFEENQKRFNELGIETRTDMILAQPEETYESWVRGIDALLNLGQHNRIQFFILACLPNSEMGDPEYQKKYGIRTVKAAMVNIHGYLPESNEIVEEQELVIATNAMPAEDWVRAMVFSWMVGLLHCDKILQIPSIILHQYVGLGYGEMFEFFSEGKFNSLHRGDKPFPILNGIRQFFIEMAKNIQNGGYEFCHAPQWLNIFWPVDEYIFIKLSIENQLTDFYKEAKRALADLLSSKRIEINPIILEDAVSLNGKLIKLPFAFTDIRVATRYNVWEFYRSVIIGHPIPLNEEMTYHVINRTQEQWFSWNEWLEKIVWFSNRKGAYLYGNISESKKSEGCC